MPFRNITGHVRPIAILKATMGHGRLGHAYLFYGEPRIGKSLTATCLAQALNCEHPFPAGDRDSCGRCRSCLQIAARTFPDYIVIEPDRESAVPQIRIERIREIEHHFIYKPLVGERKICLVDDADLLTIGAANALLKTLEEPPGHGLFILISSRPQALPATIRSRCQALRFTPLVQTEVEAALMLKRELQPADARFLALTCEGRIGEALSSDLPHIRARQHECLKLVAPDTLRSPTVILSVAESMAKADRGAEILTWLNRWIRDLVIVLIGGNQDHLVHLDQLNQLRDYAKRADLCILLDLLTEIDRTQQHTTRHLNLHLALETTLFRLRDALAFSPRAMPA